MRNIKFKSRVILVIVLTVLLVMLTFVSSTFSWYTRATNDITISGNALAYNPSNVYCSDGASVSASTMRSETGLEDSYTSTDLQNSGRSLAKGARDYYRTTFTNESTSDQYVSLYLSKLRTDSDSGSGQLCVGVNSPVKSYKNFSLRSAASQTASTSSTAANNTMRVYFEPKNVNENGWGNGNYRIYYSRSNISWSGNQPSGGSYSTENLLLSPTAGIFFYDIPSNTRQFFISVQDWQNDNQHTKVYTVGSNTNLSQTQSVDIALTQNGEYDDTNMKSNSYDVGGANIINYYNSVNLRVNNSMPISLRNGTDYIGSAEYSSSNNNVFTISNGRIVATGAGTATLTMKTKGSSYQDYSPDKTCTVTVTDQNTGSVSLEDAPVLQNIKVPAKSGTTNGTAVVDWFIMNDKYSSGSVKFSFDSLYVGV